MSCLLDKLSQPNIMFHFRPHAVTSDRDQTGLSKMDVGIADEQAFMIK